MTSLPSATASFTSTGITDLGNAPENNKANHWDLGQPGWIADWFGSNNGRTTLQPLYQTSCVVNTTNYGCFSNPTVDKALDDNRNGPDCSKAARKAANHTLDLALNQDAPYTFLYSGDTIGYAQKTLQNFQAFTFSREWNIEQWWFKK